MTSQKYGKCSEMKTFLLNRVENIVAKGEISHYEQFDLLSQCFQKSSAAEESKRIYMWDMVNPFPLIDAL